MVEGGRVPEAAVAVAASAEAGPSFLAVVVALSSEVGVAGGCGEVVAVGLSSEVGVAGVCGEVVEVVFASKVRVVGGSGDSAEVV